MDAIFLGKAAKQKVSATNGGPPALAMTFPGTFPRLPSSVFLCAYQVFVPATEFGAVSRFFLGRLAGSGSGVLKIKGSGLAVGTQYGQIR